jgi:PAS domain S-box-containing protein
VTTVSLLETFADLVTAMFGYWDHEGRCRYANKAYLTWFGRAPEALIGRHISELLGPLYELNLPHIEGALRGVEQKFEREIPDPKGGPPRVSD